MDFESPDVAKEFPGLYMGDLEVRMKSEGVDYDEDQDKSKKKKDKKKDKEKGYAALAGESSHDEDDSKSPGKSKKIKAFKLSSKKKDKEKESKPLDAHTHVSSILRTGSIREKRPFDREKKPLSEKELKKSSEKDIKTQLSSTSSSTNPRLSLPTSTSSKTAHPPPERTHSLTKNLTLNAFLNAPAPLLKKKEGATKQKDTLKKEKSREKEEVKKGKDKEHSSKESMPSLVRLKLKRGSKNSLEDSQSSDSPGVAPSHQFPETPDAIAKEIRRYEGLLEQSHAQIKASKKVSKKSEEQLWELQRTLTQLKRKLRSVNALSSASSASIILSSTDKPTIKDSEKIANAGSVSTSTGSTITNIKSGPGHVLSIVTGASASIQIPKPIQVDTTVVGVSVSPVRSDTNTVISPQQPKLDIPLNLSATAPLVVKVEPVPVPPVPVSDAVKHLSVQMDTPLDLKEHVETDETRTEEPEKKRELSKSPGETSLGKFQVHVQVHNNEVNVRDILLTPEDVFEKEINSFDTKAGNEPVRNCPSPVPTVMDAGVDTKSDITQGDSSEDYYSEEGSHKGDRDFNDDGECVDIRKVEIRTSQSDETHCCVPAFIVEESDDFDPFAVPIFHTNEFIALENDALIAFNQKLQDEIVREEERVTTLMDEYKYLTETGYRNSAMEDLESLDDDELAELWYSRKIENEALHDKVNNLRTQVVSGILEEFRLETRLRYLQEIGLSVVQDASPETLQAEV